MLSLKMCPAGHPRRFHGYRSACKLPRTKVGRSFRKEFEAPTYRRQLYLSGPFRIFRFERRFRRWK